MLATSTLVFAETKVDFTTTDSDSDDSVKYQVQIDDNDDFSSPLVDYISALGTPGSGSFTVGQGKGDGNYSAGTSGQNLADGNYFWRVKAIDSHGAQSDYSDKHDLKCAANVGTPTDFSITTGDGVAKLNWTNPTDEAFSKVRVFYKQSLANTTKNPTKVDAKDNKVSTITIDNLENEKPYTFWLVALSGSGCEYTATDTITVYPGIEEIYTVPSSLLGKLTPLAEGEGLKNSKIFGSTIGFPEKADSAVPVLIIDDKTLEFAVVDSAGKLGETTKVADLVDVTPPNKIVGLAKKVLITPAKDGDWDVFWQDDGKIFTSTSINTAGVAFSEAKLIGENVNSNWQLKVLDQNDKISVLAVTKRNNEIISFEKSGDKWAPKTLVKSSRIIKSFDAEYAKDGLVVSYQLVKPESLIGKILNLFAPASGVNVYDESNKTDSTLATGSLVDNPEIAIDATGNAHIVFWQAGADNGIESFVKKGNSWQIEKVIAQNEKGFSYHGETPLSVFYDSQNNLVVFWNSGGTNPTTLFAKMTTAGEVQKFRAQKLESYGQAPKVTPTGGSKYLLLFGNHGKMYQN